MARPRVIIANEDVDFIIRLQSEFIEKFFEQIDLEIITDKGYFDKLFSGPQKAGILIVSEEWFDSSLLIHDLDNIFVMTEKNEALDKEVVNVVKICKYINIKEIFNKIVGRSSKILHSENTTNAKGTNIIVVTSAVGGVGKTTVAMGMAACLVENYKKVLYLNAARLQTFQYVMEDASVISSQETYFKLYNPTEQVYQDIKHVIRTESFSYLPAFKTALLSLGIPYSIYGKIALSVKQSKEYDFIIIDVENTFDEECMNLIEIADKVIVVTDQTMRTVCATNAFVANISGVSAEKYLFVCNKVVQNATNVLRIPELSLKYGIEHIEFINKETELKCQDLAQSVGMKSLSLLVL